LASFVAKGLLPYRGLGSGIKRAILEWPDISFSDDREGNLFTATVHRKELEKSSEKSSEKILELLRNEPKMGAKELSNRLGISQRAVEKQIDKLKTEGRLRRIGPDKGGHWEAH